MIIVIAEIITDILYKLYEPFGFAVLLTILGLVYFMYATDGIAAGEGYKRILMELYLHLKKDRKYRKVCALIFYTAMILFTTLINRTIWLNPLSDVMGDWWIYKYNTTTGTKELSTACLENIILFIPYVYMVMSIKYENIKKPKIWSSIVYGGKIAFYFSAIIEFLQLFLRLGTFQISDFVYNTLGGILGVILYKLILITKRDG
ncbi:TPA: VanZ family protein, partial [Enterococcus faecium]